MDYLRWCNEQQSLDTRITLHDGGFVVDLGAVDPWVVDLGVVGPGVVELG